MHNRMVLTVVCWRCGMSFDANGCVSTLMNVDWIKWMDFCVNEFGVGVNDSIFSGKEQQKVYRASPYVSDFVCRRKSFFRFQKYFRPRDSILESFSPLYTNTQTRFEKVNWAAKLPHQALLRPGLTQSLRGLVCLHTLSRLFRLAFVIRSESNLRMLSLLLM